MNMPHYQPKLFKKDYDLLFSYLLHASNFLEPNNVGGRVYAEIFTYLDQVHLKWHLHIIAGSL
jgi:hypothetical protein